MDKDSRYGSYDCYKQQHQPQTKPIPRPAPVSGGSRGCCTCGCLSRKSRHLLAGIATNVGICCLLVGYTLLGSVIFLAIEGRPSPSTSSDSGHHILATTSLATTATHRRAAIAALNGSELRVRTEAARIRTVENIWDITVNLNILYRDNWTRLAAAEITRFQDEILRSIAEETGQLEQQHHHQHHQQQVSSSREVPVREFEWTFAKSFLYSLTVLTTIGYGSLAPRTALGKAVTMGYAVFGIPLTLLYLSSVGAILSRIARGVFSRALCCCLCSNCGYCCYDEKRMAEKERRMRKKRQQMEMLQQQQMALQEPFYVRTTTGSPTSKDADSFSALDNDSKASSSSLHHGAAILAPIALCLCIMLAYICVGALVLFHLERWPPLDGFYFCFMSLTTIGFGAHLMPEDLSSATTTVTSPTTIWFCSVYIMSGMALTAMCFNVVHDEIVHRLRHEERRLRKTATLTSFPDVSEPLPPAPPS